MWTAVAAGSAAGGLARHLVTDSVTRMAGTGFPWGTLLVNVAGSVAIGVCTGLAVNAAPGSWSPTTRHAVMTGVLGGFTTFSTFSIQTVALLQAGQWPTALANVVVSVGAGLTGCWLGLLAASGGR